ncbi:ribosomal protein S6 kinase, putative [Phytophthora infestans T30-4]|uniref:Ribosomal protein S6 kinase, putative n=1 Tax=Phytophthora infestans (strain T30-4) TaxID=403677 RepID=D0NRM5_PHYIT|nr:ribosomal protein S6 kinase, putative [Phytophthora infestans T30-4]EEY63375.1 ribosomal protein S6 kinase, putative [Phytophthora infestans T30-4]|eukprot:XP_002898260.1 ribosomal protein S6 kinase, putative [Phytophthora infestans T30-4]
MEALLHQIVLEEQQKMVQLGFVETCIPSPDSAARCSVFMSANWHICRRLLLVIVSGNGIQPGIWSRSLVLEATENPNQYRSGSMLPYLHTALSKGYGVVVMNPSTNTVSVGSEKIPIPYSSTPELHVRYVWEAYGVRASCSQVYIAAYGRGGSLTKHLVCTQPLLRSKLAAIAFIESSHRVEADDTQEVRGLLGTRAINWQRSKESPGTQLQDCTQLGCLSLSAGEPTSPAEQKSSNTAWTIAASMDTVFAFFDSARGSMPDKVAEDELMDEMSRLSQYAYAGAAAMSSAPHQQEHLEDAEFHVEEDVGNHLGRRSNSARSSRRSMVISTSMSVNDFDLLSVVGKGAYGKVFLAKKKHGKNAGRVYAMKVLRKQDVFKKKQVEHTKSEQRILKHVEHPFVVRLRYAFQNHQKLYLVMDYYSGGSLFVHLRKEKRFTEQRACFYAAELVLSLAHLHNMHIMYRDLKLENILMDSDGHVAITDFGLSKEDDEGSTFVGTPEYLAPELLCSQRTATSYGNTIDWWSYGVLVYEMIQGHTPFWDKNRRQMFQNILSKEPIYPSEHFSPTATDFLRRLLVKNPRQRLGCGADGAREIMGHPWFEGVDWDALLNRRVEPPFRPVAKDIHGSRARTSSAALNANLQYVPNIFKQQEVADSPVISVLGSSTGSGIMAMHFDDFSYMGSDIIGSRRTSVFRDSDIKMELGE